MGRSPSPNRGDRWRPHSSSRSRSASPRDKQQQLRRGRHSKSRSRSRSPQTARAAPAELKGRHSRSDRGKNTSRGREGQHRGSSRDRGQDKDKDLGRDAGRDRLDSKEPRRSSRSRSRSPKKQDRQPLRRPSSRDRDRSTGTDKPGSKEQHRRSRSRSLDKHEKQPLRRAGSKRSRSGADKRAGSDAGKQQQLKRRSSRSRSHSPSRDKSRPKGGSSRDERPRQCSRSRSRDKRRSSRHSRSRSRSRDKSLQKGGSSRDERPRHRSRNRSRSKNRSRRSSRSRSRDAPGGGRRRRRDEEQAVAAYPGPTPAFPGPPPDDHHAAKRSRWGEPQQQQQQQQQRGWGELPGPPPQSSRWDAGRTGDRRGPAGPPLSDEPPAVGTIHRGVVQTIKPFGVFVAIEGFKKHVLIHHTQVSDLVMLTRSDEDELKVKALEYAAQPGQRVWAKVVEVSPDPGGGGYRVHGSMKVVDQETGSDLDPTGQMAAQKGPGAGGGRGPLSDEPPEVGSIHKGEVKRIEAYGVFVALPGYRKYGLVHASQVANFLEFSAEDGEAERKKAIGDIVDLGQEVWVKVVEVGEDEKGRGPKIGCSMKLVDQGDGTDLDPQNMRYRPRGEGGGHAGGTKAPIGAHVGEVKGGAIDWGYLATRPDAFGSKGYDLLNDAPPEAMPQQGGSDHHHQQHHHHHQQQQQRQAMPPMGRGRGATMPAWMTQGVGATAAPGAAAAAAAAAAPTGQDMDLEQALRIVQEAAAGKSHKKKHKKERSSKKHKKEKKSSSSRKHSRRHRSHSRTSSGTSSDRS